MALMPDDLPDWRDPAAYPFERLDRAGFAWEWLRRDPGYREASRQHFLPFDGAAARWGLVRFEPAELAAPHARAFWRADIDGEVLVADALDVDARHHAALRLGEIAALLSVTSMGNVTCLLVTDGWRRLRIDLHGDVAVDRTLLPRWRLAGMELRLQLRALTRLAAVYRSGDFPSRLWPRDPRTRRWILALRAHDALSAGARHRDLAALLGGDASSERWRVREPTIRLQAQRLAMLARKLQGRAFADKYLSGPT
jgi:hypothetical protein